MTQEISEQKLPIINKPSTTPTIVDDLASQDLAVSALQGGSGPVAIDVERAQSFRYCDKAYLVQIKRQDAGIFIFDPIAFEDDDHQIADFSAVAHSFADQPWIIHAASQDLANLVQLSMVPKNIFDTELAGRLLGFPRVALGTMVEKYFGMHLLKQHSADDWSSRPIPSDWINYAALDVEFLIELREKLVVDLENAGKDQWAQQEFEYLAARYSQPNLPKQDPWRHTSGTHLVHSRLGMALVRELWTTRDRIAKTLDKAPNKILQDQAITALASRADDVLPSMKDVKQIDGFRRRIAKRYLDEWRRSLVNVAQLSDEELPPLRLRNPGPPAIRNWQFHNPSAARRWQYIRPKIVELATKVNVPVENLISPDILRSTLWCPEGSSLEDIDAQLASLGARAWQRELITEIIVSGLRNNS